MGLIQIDESEYQGQVATLKALEGMLNNKEARKLVLKARKLADPNAVIPEIDAAEPVNAELKALQDRITAFEKQQNDITEANKQKELTDKFVNTWNSKKLELREQGFNTDYVNGVEKLAQERGIADFDAAQALFDKQNPSPSVGEPNGYRGNGLFEENPADDEFMKKLIAAKGDDDNLVMGEANKVLKELRSNNRR